MASVGAVASSPSGSGSDPTTSTVSPIRISKINSRYFVFSAVDVMRLRRTYNMCSVFAGTTPLAPSQNAFLSLPLELMVEEARLLLAKGAAYVVDGADMHVSGLVALVNDPERRREYIAGLRAQRGVMERIRAEERRSMQEEVLARKAAAGKLTRKKKNGKKKEGTSDYLVTAASGVKTDVSEGKDSSSKPNEPNISPALPPSGPRDVAEGEEIYIAPESEERAEEDPRRPLPKAKLNITKLSLTPTSSVPELINPPISSLSSPSTAGQVLPPFVSTSPSSIPEPRSYALYAHIHSKGYFMTPGIRFGCDFSVYPGDPMRFHAHFLATSFGWDEEIGMLDLVGPGRLATAVKKGFVIGGEKPRDENDGSDGDGEDGGCNNEEPGARVRAFSIEWAGI